MLMKSLYKIFMILLLVQSTTNAVTLNNDRDTILELGMEMSDMRNMLEAYILIGAKVDYKNPTQKLKDGMVHYEELLRVIKVKYPLNTEIQESISTSLNAWKIVKSAMELALGNANLEALKKGAIFIHDNIRTVIKEMAHMKKILLDTSRLKNKEALNASIEIAASARRLSAHYMMDLWHLNDPTIQKHWNKGLKIYADSLEILKTSPFVNNHQFNVLLKNSIKLHKYFTRMGEKSKIFSILIDKKANIAFNEAKEMTNIILQSK